MRKGRSRSFYSWLVTSWSGKLGVSYLSIFFGLICFVLLVSALTFLSMSFFPTLFGTLPTLTFVLLVTLAILFIAAVIYYWYWWHKEDFPPASYSHLRHQVLERVVKLDTRAKRDGRSEEPGEGSRDISKTESDVKLEATQHIEQQVRINRKNIVNLEHGLSESLELLEENPHLNSLSRLDADLDDFFNRFDHDISSYERKIQRAHKDLREFKEDNQLEREPYVRHSWHFYLGIVIILVLIFGEAWFNSTLFQDVLRGGSTAAYGLTIGISMINVGMSFIVGRLVIPNLWHTAEERSRKWLRRLSAFFGTIGYMFFITYVNLMAGTFRAAAVEQAKTATGFDTSQSEAYTQVTWPFTQEALSTLDFESQLFIGLGFLFAVISILDGIFFDDRYPGYGHKGRTLHDAEEKIETLIRRFKREYKSIFIEAGLKADFDEEQRRISLSDWKNIHDALQMTETRYDRLLDSVEKASKHALEQYKAINKKNRITGAPQYWSEEIALPVMLPFDKQYSSIYYEMISDETKAQKALNYTDRIRNERSDHQHKLDAFREESQENLKRKINSSQEKVNELSVTSGRLMERYNR